MRLDRETKYETLEERIKEEQQRRRRTYKEIHGFLGRFPDFSTEGIPPCSETDPEAFFPDKGMANTSWEEMRMAKNICKACPYKTPCLDWAIDNREFGIWGGTTERERRPLRRSRRVAS